MTHEFKRRDAGKAISNINIPKGMEPVVEEPAAPVDKYASVRPKINSSNPGYKPDQKKENVNYFQQNIKNMRKYEREMAQERKENEAAAAEAAKPEKLGQVPVYLQKRK